MKYANGEEVRRNDRVKWADQGVNIFKVISLSLTEVELVDTLHEWATRMVKPEHLVLAGPRIHYITNKRPSPGLVNNALMEQPGFGLGDFVKRGSEIGPITDIESSGLIGFNSGIACWGPGELEFVRKDPTRECLENLRPRSNILAFI